MQEYQNSLEELKTLRNAQRLLKVGLDQLRSSGNEGQGHSPQFNPSEGAEDSQLRASRGDLPRRELEEVERALREDLAKSKDELSVFQSRVAVLEANLTSSTNEQRGFEQHSRALQTQLETLQQSHATLNARAKQLENENVCQRSHLEETKKQLIAVEQELQQLRPTKLNLEKGQLVLQQQVRELEADKTLLRNCIEKLQTQSNSYEKFTSKHESDSSQELKSCREELSHLQAAKMKEFETYRETMCFRDKQLEELTYEIERHRNSHRESLSEKAVLESNMHHAQAQVEDLRQQVAAADARLNLLIKQGVGTASGMSSRTFTGTSDLKLESALDQIKSLEEELTHAKEEQEEHKRALEISDRASSEAFQQTQRALQREEEWREKFQASQQKLEDLLAQLERASRDTHGQKDRMVELESTVAQFTAQCKEYEVKWQNTEEKYQQEMKSHAQDIAQLDKARELSSSREEQIQLLSGQLHEVSTDLSKMQAAGKQEVQALQDRIQQLLAAKEDLDVRNTLLISQLETLVRDPELMEADEGSVEKSNLELRQIIQSILKEKLAIQTEKQTAEERLRVLQGREDRLLAERDQLLAKLSRESVAGEQPGTTVGPSEKYLTALQESNALLRRENTESQKKLEAKRRECLTLEQRLVDMDQLKIELEGLKRENEDLNRKDNDWNQIIDQITESNSTRQFLQSQLEEKMKQIADMEQQHLKAKKTQDLKRRADIQKLKAHITQLQQQNTPEEEIELESVGVLPEAVQVPDIAQQGETQVVNLPHNDRAVISMESSEDAAIAIDLEAENGPIALEELEEEPSLPPSDVTPFVPIQAPTKKRAREESVAEPAGKKPKPNTSRPVIGRVRSLRRVVASKPKPQAPPT